MDKGTVLRRIEELHLIYEDGVLSHPLWYVPNKDKKILGIHSTLFGNKNQLKLTLNEVAALLLKHDLLDVNEG
jgi:hypothetical protein